MLEVSGTAGSMLYLALVPMASSIEVKKVPCTSWFFGKPMVVKTSLVMIAPRGINWEATTISTISNAGLGVAATSPGELPLFLLSITYARSEATRSISSMYMTILPERFFKAAIEPSWNQLMNREYQVNYTAISKYTE